MNTLKKILFLAFLGVGFGATAQDTAITVYRSASCGCCSKWVAHLERNQFKVNDVVSDDMPAKKTEAGVPQNVASCHTALVDGYLIEGHVPAVDIRQLLKLKPKVAGIAVPGMPIGTPGMEMEGQTAPYHVISFDRQGNVDVFARHQ